ncbi:MAG TPA: L,D-transpeptidase family protein [Longimicrobium sp.]|nr:L,D-transpeptidase family protein [Longimicrobium sp.]
MRKMLCAALVGCTLAAAACKVEDNRGEKAGPPQRGTAEAAQPAGGADLQYVQDSALTPQQIEQGRFAQDWTKVVKLDTTGAGVPVRNPEKWEQINTQRVNGGAMVLPLSGEVSGPSVLRVQILLDRALFSPGEMDGHYGKNTAKAVYFFQQTNGLPATARVDSATFQALARSAGSPQDLVTQRRLTADDVKGPFVEIPENIQDQAKLECSCYNSLTEKLGETYHISPEVLKMLNPGVNLDGLQAGQTINVPLVRDANAGRGTQVAQIVVSGQGSYVQAQDASGKILFHFPSTLGATYDPSPSGEFKVTNIEQNPVWHYQPELIATASDTAHEAMVPGGPNNRVGAVWMALSAPHYGIHGTNKPETIGYATSSGCVRLTNWDAQFLSHHISRGVPVHFRDIQGRAGGQSYGDQGMTSGGGARGGTASGAKVDSAASAASGQAKGGTHGTPGAGAKRPGSGSRDTSSSTRRNRSGTGGTRDTTKTR